MKVFPPEADVAGLAEGVPVVLMRIANIVIGEYASIVQTIIFGALAAFVAWARFGPYAVEPCRAGQVAQG